MEITTDPTTTTINSGTAPTLTDMRITATYSDGSTDILTSADVTTNIPNADGKLYTKDANESGKFQLKVTYQGMESVDYVEFTINPLTGTVTAANADGTSNQTMSTTEGTANSVEFNVTAANATIDRVALKTNVEGITWSLNPSQTLLTVNVADSVAAGTYYLNIYATNTDTGANILVDDSASCAEQITITVNDT